MTPAQLEVDQLIRKEFGLGKNESGSLRIAHCKDVRLPQFRFEWHPGTQKVHRCDLPGSWIDGQWVESVAEVVGYCIAEHCLTHAQFLGFVQTFCRGYLVAINHQRKGLLSTYAPPRITETDACPIR